MNNETKEKLKKIPAGAVIYVHSNGWIGKIIQEVEPGKIPNTINPNHTAVYIGGGGNFVFEANPSGAEFHNIKKYLDDKDCIVSIWTLPEMTVEQMEQIKTNCYEAEDRPYDWEGVSRFVIKYFSWIPFLGGYLKKQIVNKWKPAYCSELKREMITTKTGIVMSPAADYSPADSEADDYNRGWELLACASDNQLLFF